MLITIKIGDNVMAVHEGRLARSRLVWRAAGLDVYVVGPLAGMNWERAANLAMNYALSIHVPISSMRTQK